MIEELGAGWINREEIPENVRLKEGRWWDSDPIDEKRNDQDDEKRERAVKVLGDKLLFPMKAKKGGWRCHLKGEVRFFYWAYRYDFLGALIYQIHKAHREYRLTCGELCQIFDGFQKGLRRWKWLPPRKLMELDHEAGRKIAKYQKGPRVAFLLHLFLEYQIYEMATILVAQEEGRAPGTIYKGRMKARAFMKSHTLSLSFSRQKAANSLPA